MINCLRYIPPQLYPTKVLIQKGGYKRGMTVYLNPRPSSTKLQFHLIDMSCCCGGFDFKVAQKFTEFTIFGPKMAGYTQKVNIKNKRIETK